MASRDAGGTGGLFAAKSKFSLVDLCVRAKAGADFCEEAPGRTDTNKPVVVADQYN